MDTFPAQVCEILFTTNLRRQWHSSEKLFIHVFAKSDFFEKFHPIENWLYKDYLHVVLKQLEKNYQNLFEVLRNWVIVGTINIS